MINCDSIKALQIKTLVVSNLVFPSNTILSLFFLSFLVTHLYFLISGMIVQIFTPTTELAIPTEAPSNEANAKIETQLLTAETKTRNCSKYFKSLHVFLLTVSFYHVTYAS